MKVLPVGEVTPTGCILWTGAKFKSGYGAVRFLGKTRTVHRVAWYLAHGVWPVDELDHKCRVRACYNVEHLEDVTHQENARRSPIMGKQRPEGLCAKGLHPWIPENLYPHGRGYRCRQCVIDKTREARSLARDRAQALRNEPSR